MMDEKSMTTSRRLIPVLLAALPSCNSPRKKRRIGSALSASGLRSLRATLVAEVWAAQNDSVHAAGTFDALGQQLHSGCRIQIRRNASRTRACPQQLPHLAGIPASFGAGGPYVSEVGGKGHFFQQGCPHGCIMGATCERKVCAAPIGGRFTVEGACEHCVSVQTGLVIASLQ